MNRSTGTLELAARWQARPLTRRPALARRRGARRDGRPACAGPVRRRTALGAGCELGARRRQARAALGQGLCVEPGGLRRTAQGRRTTRSSRARVTPCSAASGCAVSTAPGAAPVGRQRDRAAGAGERRPERRLRPARTRQPGAQGLCPGVRHRCRLPVGRCGQPAGTLGRGLLAQPRHAARGARRMGARDRTAATAGAARGAIVQQQIDPISWLLGLRYITEREVTWFAELYHNGAGYTDDEYAAFLQAAAMRHAATGRQRWRRPPYLRANPGRDYAQLRISRQGALRLAVFGAGADAHRQPAGPQLFADT
ncbi:MAG: hypothetical protein MZU91_12455 [Desulfosudis oleivorans]|nr:hypothetical protein [Desulfosudis oleivorans]